MKKILFVLTAVLLFCACSDAPQKPQPFNQEQMLKVFSDYLSLLPPDNDTEPFKACNFEYREAQPVGRSTAAKAASYVCQADIGGQTVLIAVVSDAAEFKTEVDGAFNNNPNIYYIARLKFDKEAKSLQGKKELFDWGAQTVIRSKDIES